MKNLIIFIPIIIMIFVINYIYKAYQQEWRTFENINNEINIVYKVNIFGHNIVKSKYMVQQRYLHIRRINNAVDLLDNEEAIARYMITNEDLAVIWKNNKWLLA